MSNTRLQRRGITFTPERMFARQSEQMRDTMRRFFGAPVDRLFPEPSLPELFTQPVGWYPAVEVSEMPAEFLVTAELPGLKQEDVTVEFIDGILSIRGEKQEEKKEEEGKRYLLWERNYGAFQRSFTLPGEVDGAKIKAEFGSGILTVHLPKVAAAKPNSRKIEVVEKK